VDFDPTWLLVSLVVSGVGFVLFNYGRKMSRVPHLVSGIVMMVYPYFIRAWLPMSIVAVAISAVLWVVVRLGW
jgi:hypothetical protein